MRHQHLKPIYWGLFAGGGTIAALIMPALVVIFGIMLPFGLIADPNHLQFSLQDCLGRWWIFIPIAFLLFMVLWHCLHRLYYVLHDMHFNVNNNTRVAFYTCAVFIFLLTCFCGL